MNFGVFLAGILIFSPVRGFLPVLALRFPAENVPKCSMCHRRGAEDTEIAFYAQSGDDDW